MISEDLLSRARLRDTLGRYMRVLREMGGNFNIMSYKGMHTCQRKFVNNQARSSWVVEKFGDYSEENSTTKNVTLRNIIRKDLYVEMPDHTLWRAKQIKSYGQKHEYVNALKRLSQYGKVVSTRNTRSVCAIQRVTTFPNEPPIQKSILKLLYS